MLENHGQNKCYDALRGVFGIIVVLVHVEYIRSFFGYANHYAIPAIYHVGRICVSGFFVLSGFLITRKLLKLKEEALPVSKKFGVYYLKRALRIFPLYYTIILLSMYVLPQIRTLHYNIPAGVHDARTMLPEVSKYYYFFMPQIPLAHRIVLPFAEPTWSIGIEELFYLIMPLLVLLLPLKKNWLLLMAAVSVIIKFCYRLTIDEHFTDPVFALMIYCRFECILMGCYAAYLYCEDAPLFRKINRNHALIASALLPVFLYAMRLESYLFVHFSICFAVIILYLAKGSFKFLENRILVFYGKISFCLYMVHEIAIVFILNKGFFSSPQKHSGLALYISILIAATALAFIFYKLVEEPFMKIKGKLDKNAQNAKLKTQEVKV